MHGNGKQSRIIPYVPFSILAGWAVLVMFRFYQEHTLGLRRVWELTLDFQAPPLPADLLKIALAARHLLLACILAIIGMLAGRRLLRMGGICHPEPHSADKWDIGQHLMLALGLGWGLLMYLIFFLGVAGGLYAAAIWGLLLLLLLICLRDVPPLLRDLRILFKPDKRDGMTVVTRVGMAVMAFMLILIAVIALAPSITHDAMVYHLGVPRIYADAHRIVAIPYNLFSNTVFNLEMLYMVALLIDDYTLANLIHYLLGIATLVFFYGFAKSNFGRVTAVLATFIFFFNPPVLSQMSIAYGDVGMTFYFLLAVYSLWRWKTEGSGRWFVLLCVFAGIFAGMKYTSIYGLFSLSVMIAAIGLSAGERRIGNTVKHLALFGGIVTIFLSPYLVKNYLITGNPVYPALYDIFGGRWLLPRQVARMLAYVDSHGMGHDWRSLLALPWNITILGKIGFANFDTTITPLWLIFLPAFLFIRPKPTVLKWAGVLCVVYFLSWAASTHITRYMMPMFPVLSLVCAHTIVVLDKRAAAVSRPLSTAFKAGAVLVCGLVCLSFSYFYPLLVPSEFGPVLWGKQTRDEFLAKKVLNYPAFKYINEKLPADANLVFFWDNRGFFCERPKIGDSVLEAPMMIELLHEAGSPGAFHDMLREMGVTHVFSNELFLTRFPPHRISEEDHARFADDIKMFKVFLSRYCVPLFSADWATVYALRE